MNFPNSHERKIKLRNTNVGQYNDELNSFMKKGRDNDQGGI